MKMWQWPMLVLWVLAMGALWTVTVMGNAHQLKADDLRRVHQAQPVCAQASVYRDAATGQIIVLCPRGG
jgi:hypothetical protein